MRQAAHRTTQKAYICPSRTINTGMNYYGFNPHAAHEASQPRTPPVGHTSNHGLAALASQEPITLPVRFKDALFCISFSSALRRTTVARWQHLAVMSSALHVCGPCRLSTFERFRLVWSSADTASAATARGTRTLYSQTSSWIQTWSVGCRFSYQRAGSTPGQRHACVTHRRRRPPAILN